MWSYVIDVVFDVVCMFFFSVQRLNTVTIRPELCHINKDTF